MFYSALASIPQKNTKQLINTIWNFKFLYCLCVYIYIVSQCLFAVVFINLSIYLVIPDQILAFWYDLYQSQKFIVISRAAMINWLIDLSVDRKLIYNFFDDRLIISVQVLALFLSLRVDETIDWENNWLIGKIISRLIDNEKNRLFAALITTIIYVYV